MLKMIICDDDKIFCSSFEDLVIEICRERNLKYEIFMFYETVYFESENKIVKIHCTNNIIKFYGKLNDVEQKLNDSFIRIHSSILVNSVYIAQFKYNEVKMINGELLPISQSRRQYIRKKQMDRWENNS